MSEPHMKRVRIGADERYSEYYIVDEDQKFVGCTECPECGYTVRTTQKWLDVGAPFCPTDNIPLEAEKKEIDED